MNILSIALFNQRSNAELLQRRLSAEGITTQIHDCGMKVSRLDVSIIQFERADQLTRRWDAAEGGLAGLIRCPECHSLRVEYPQYSRRSIIPNLLIRLLANIGAVPKEFYCHDCHFTWPREGDVSSRKRPHMAPYYFIEGIAQPQQKETKHAA
jgi:hypothetical protein